MAAIHVLVFGVMLSQDHWTVALPFASSGYQSKDDSKSPAQTTERSSGFGMTLPFIHKITTPKPAIKNPLDGIKVITEIPKPTTKDYVDGIKVIMEAKTTIAPQPPDLRDYKCYRVGIKAAKLGYSCYINLAIAERRLNMPQRYKMKLEQRGEKWGYAFARKMQFCAKSYKHSGLFYRGCDKVASAMDNVPLERRDYIFNTGR